MEQLKKFLVFTIAASSTLSCADVTAAIIGSYEGTIAVGSSATTTIVRCTSESLCEVEARSVINGIRQPQLPPQKLQAELLTDMAQVHLSMKYARDHAAISSSSDREDILAIFRAVRPLLNSNVRISSCVDLRSGGVICELESSPWGRPAILYGGTDLSNCQPDRHFCGYTFLPLFQTHENAQLQGLAAPPSPQASSHPVPAEAEEYVRAVQDRIQSALQIPSGTPLDAKVDLQIQFSQQAGNIYSINPVGDEGRKVCDSFCQAVWTAARTLKSLPPIPEDKWKFLSKDKDGSRHGAVYLTIRAAP